MPCAVILNVVKNLLNDITLRALSMVGFEEMLRYTQYDIGSGNRNKPPFVKGRFGGNVNMSDPATTTILRDTKKALQSARPIFRQSGADVVMT